MDKSEFIKRIEEEVKFENDNNEDIRIEEDSYYKDEYIITVTYLSTYAFIGSKLLNNELNFKFDKEEGIIIKKSELKKLMDWY